jgi:hypothetical protein
MRILFLGDIFGKLGRKVVTHYLKSAKSQLKPDLIIANAENSAGGIGATPDTAKEILEAGVHVLTGGNHTFHHKEFHEFLSSEPRVLRPANFPPGAPGRGFGVFAVNAESRVGVLNLQGRVFMDHLDCPFREAERILEMPEMQELPIFCDFHAEATAEKMAFWRHYSNRLCAVVGTHTHIQTADEQIQDGCAFICDVGMCGGTDSIIGMKPAPVIARLVSGMHQKYQPQENGPAQVCAVLIELDGRGRAASIQRIFERYEQF